MSAVLVATEEYRRLYKHDMDGMDGSHFQRDKGPIDWNALVGSVNWLAWKASQSIKYKDPTLNEFRNGTQQGLEMGAIIGRWLYHWISSTTHPVEQAWHYLRTIGYLRPGEGVMLDAEEKGITEEGCLMWLETVERATEVPSSVYTGLYVAGGTIWTSPRIRMSKYGPRPMHLAAYVNEADLLLRMRTLGVLHLPMHAWQFSSRYVFPGVIGGCDANNIIDIKAFLDARRPLRTVPKPPIVNPLPQPTNPIIIKSEEDEVDYLIRNLINGETAHVSQSGAGVEMTGITKSALPSFERMNLPVVNDEDGSMWDALRQQRRLSGKTDPFV